jgi:hypothetical protein
MCQLFVPEALCKVQMMDSMNFGRKSHSSFSFQNELREKAIEVRNSYTWAREGIFPGILDANRVQDLWATRLCSFHKQRTETEFLCFPRFFSM